MAPATTKFGPGTLKIGDPTTGVQIEANLIGCRIKTNVNTEDPIFYLSGDSEPGATTFDSELTGNLNVDAMNGNTSLFDLSWSAKGTEQAFEFVPHNDIVTATGVLVITPLDLGADKFGDRLNSEFTWALVGDPTFTYGPAVP